MAISATCPACKQVITGTLEDVRRHYGACAAKAGRVKKTPSKDQAGAETVASGLPELASVVFFIPGELTSSLNKMLHEHRGESYADKARWRAAVTPLLAGYEPARNKRRVEIFRSARRELDPDNLAGSMKFLIDAIKDTGALVDDTSKWIEFLPSQGWMQREGKGMLVRITDLGGDNHANEEAGQAARGEEAQTGVQATPDTAARI